MGGRQGGGRVVVRGPQHSSLGQDGITYQGELAWLLDAGWEVDSCSGQLPPSPPPLPPCRTPHAAHVEAVLERKRQDADGGGHRVTPSHPVPEAKGVLREGRSEWAHAPGSGRQSQCGMAHRSCSSAAIAVPAGTSGPHANTHGLTVLNPLHPHPHPPTHLGVDAKLPHELEVGADRHHVLGHRLLPQLRGQPGAAAGDGVVQVVCSGGTGTVISAASNAGLSLPPA